MGDAHNSDFKKHARAQHNALERRRRDNIKDMYSSLKHEIPSFSNERASRAQILKKTIEQIDKYNNEVQELDSELKQIEEGNEKLRQQIVELKAAREREAPKTGQWPLSEDLPHFIDIILSM